MGEAESWGREWTSEGETIEADLVKVFEGEEGALNVALREADGYLYINPVSVFSELDQEFIQNYQSKKINSGGNVIKKGRFVRGSQKSLVVSSKMGEKTNGNPEKYAVLIGVTAYPNFSEELQLHYCGKDMDLLAETLRGNGFSPENIFTLTNEEGSLEPTKDNIEHQIESVLKMAGS